MIINTLVGIVEFLLLAAGALVAGYLALLSILALFTRKVAETGTEPLRRFAIVVPAHNEEGTISGTLQSLNVVDYPSDMYDVTVVADNCSDNTATVARACGARVLERIDIMNRGKGYALRWAFDTLLAGKPVYDAFIVIDADSVVTVNFVKVMNTYLERGAKAIQSADLVVPNRRSWSTEITRLGFTLYNYVRPLGRKVLGFSAGLRGNGMCFDAELLRRIPWNAFGVTEDLQYGLTLLLSGETVRFAPEAIVYATMPALANNAVSQRVRWEKGRAPIKKNFSLPLLRQAIGRQCPAALDAWLDLVTPPFVHLMAAILLAVLVHSVLAIVSPGTVSAYLPAWITVFTAGITHVMIGLIAARADKGQYTAILYIPLYVGWKFWSIVTGRSAKPPEEWIRTTRETHSTHPVVTERDDL